MTILFVVSYSPWPTVSGGAWRSFKCIRHLSERNDVVVALCESDAAVCATFMGDISLTVRRCMLGQSVVPPPASYLAAVWKSQPVYSPFRLRKRWRRSFLAACESVEPDLVWFSELSAFWRCGPTSRCAVVTDMADIQALKEARTLAAEIAVSPSALMLGTDGLELLQRRDLSWRYYVRPRWLPLTGGRRSRESKVLQVALAERWTVCGSHAVVLANPADAPYVEPLTRCVIVPNGFDFDGSGPSVRNPTGPTLIFFGLLIYRPNIDGLKWFCERVWPRVLASIPLARLEIVGEHDERLSFAAAVPNVTVNGFVEDMSDIINRSSGLIVPLLSGGGTRIKILEAWARRLPVVSTSVGAEGLGGRDGVNMLVADEPSAFAEKCVRLLNDSTLGSRLAEEGFRHGSEHYEWSKVLSGIDTAVEVARTEFTASSGRR